MRKQSFGALSLAGFFAVSAAAALPPTEVPKPSGHELQVESCPAGLASLPRANPVVLYEAASACLAEGFLETGSAFLVAAMMRLSVDHRLAPPEIEANEWEAVSQPVAYAAQQAFAELQVHESEASRAMLVGFDDVFGWELAVRGYEPAWPSSELSDFEAYRQTFRRETAAARAAQFVDLKAGGDEQLSWLSSEIQTALGGSHAPAGETPEQVRALVEEFGAHKDQLRDRYLDEYQPEMVIADIDNWGIYESLGEPTHIVAEDTADGTYIIPEEIRFLEESRIVPAEVGLAFGFGYTLHGIVPGSEERLQMRAIHPPMINLDGELQMVSTTTFDINAWNGRVEDKLTYAFTREDQLLLGDWTLQVVYYDEVLLSETFEVVAVD